MPTYLGEYPNCAPDRERKFIEAVQSFLMNTYYKKELVIVSDGCTLTNTIYEKRFKRFKNIKLVKMPKHELDFGIIPQAGCDAATGHWLAFLDSDDIIAPFHLKNIVSSIEDSYDWLYFPAFYKLPKLGGRVIEHNVEFEIETMNTGTFAYKKGLDVTWAGHAFLKSNKYIIGQLMEKYPPPHCKKINGCGYLICRGEIAKFEPKNQEA